MVGKLLVCSSKTLKGFLGAIEFSFKTNCSKGLFSIRNVVKGNLEVYLKQRHCFPETNGWNK